MRYETVDPVIRAWTERHKLMLTTSCAAGDARFCYIPGGRQECFQIWIEPPQTTTIWVHTVTIETIDDAEMEYSWMAEIDELDCMLERAIQQVEAWKDRPKGPATWSFPASWTTPDSSET